MKRKTAKDILADSFRELAETRPIDKITVKEIAANCGYSSATFYRQFKDKYDLIAWEYTHSVASIMEQINTDDYPWNRTLLDGMLSYMERKDYLANLFLHTEGQDSFIRYMTGINCDALRNYILKASGMSELDQTTEMYIRIYCLGTVNMTCEWILGKYDVTPEQLADIFEQSLPAPLHPWLYTE